jgi:hypothetical protein
LFLKVALTSDKRDPNVKKRSRYYERVFGFEPPPPPQRNAKRQKTEPVAVRHFSHLPNEKPPPEPEPEPETPSRRKLQLHSANNPKGSILARIAPFLQPVERRTPVEPEQETPAEEDIDLGQDEDGDVEVEVI